MRKQDLVQKVAEKANYYKKDVALMLDCLRDVVAESLMEGKTVKIKSFITFTPIFVPERIVRNPKTEERKVTEAHIRVKLTAADTFKARINGEEEN